MPPIPDDEDAICNTALVPVLGELVASIVPLMLSAFAGTTAEMLSDAYADTMADELSTDDGAKHKYRSLSEPATKFPELFVGHTAKSALAV